MFYVFRYYFTSRNKKVYRAISREFGTSVRHVYCLAHGRRTKNNMDYYIVKRLKEEGIISSTIYW